MTNINQPMFKLLLETLKEADSESKAMFFADPEKDLMRAYQEGTTARQKKLPMSANPYPKPSEDEEVSDGGKYSLHLCWSEGYMEVFIKED